MGRITVSSAKAKGRRLQQWVANKISELLSIPWGPDEMIASREGCQNGTDVRLVGEALSKFPFSVECKACESWAVPSWIEQSKANQLPNTDWLLFCRRSRKKGQSGITVVVMDAERFFKIMEKIKYE